jgi:hypothetical protein
LIIFAAEDITSEKGKRELVLGMQRSKLPESGFKLAIEGSKHDSKEGQGFYLQECLRMQTKLTF